MTNEPLTGDRSHYVTLLVQIKDYAIFTIDPNGIVWTWNEGAAQLTGYSTKEALSQQISFLFETGEPGNQLTQILLSKVKKSGIYEEQRLLKRKDKSIFWGVITISTFYNEEKKISGFGIVIHDRTQNRNTENETKLIYSGLEKLIQKRESEITDYKHALDIASIVAITDQKGIIKHVNENFCLISKYSKEELIGKDHRIINSGFHSKEFIRNLWVTIAKGQIWKGELMNKAKDGTIYWVDTTIIPFLDENRKPFQYLAIRSDITQRKIAEEELKRVNEDLEKKVKDRTYELTLALEREKELSELKSRFVSLASHEFRTPLSAILTSNSLIDRYKTEEQKENIGRHIERIKSSVMHLTDILNDFLSVEKLETGKVEVSRSKFNMVDLMEDVIEEISGMLKKKDQKISYEAPASLEVFQDKKILKNILLNLLSNASKYSAEERTIYIQMNTQENQISFSIRDEGIGIPEESQKELFGKFYRAPNAVNIQGTGLGLNIVKKYVELLDGQITFKSIPGKGSEFKVSFSPDIS